MLRADKIAIIGDLHGRYNGLDNDYLERSGCDLVLFVGDLGSGTLKNGLEMIRIISRLRVPGLVMPGNNDSPHLAALHAELTFQTGKSELLRLMGTSQRKAVEPCGFTSHNLSTAFGGVTLIAARPCAMGGSECSFADQLSRNHNIANLDDSAGKLKSLVDAAEHSDLIFLAHNGPFGLGESTGDPWARDFDVVNRPNAPKDWGDSDLRAAIEYAQQLGKRVIAVIAGHMHRSHKNERPLLTQVHHTSYVNAAFVPRIQVLDGCEKHHYVELDIDLSSSTPAQLNERWVKHGQEVEEVMRRI